VILDGYGYVVWKAWVEKFNGENGAGGREGEGGGGIDGVCTSKLGPKYTYKAQS
jgi:hypothetical protein